MSDAIHIDDADTFDTLSAAETAAWIGVSVESLIEFEFYGQVPSPRTVGPLTWHAADLHDWQAAGCPTRTP